jgi:small redox-active disulfide protein 2
MLIIKNLSKMEIKVLGTGCPKCKSLEKATRDAVTELGLNANVEKEEDIMKIMEYGIMHTPALVIDGKVVASGRVPNEKELKTLLTNK